MYEELILNLHGIGCKNNCVFCGVMGEYANKNLADKIAREELKKLDYLKENKNIKRIIISGNDPIEYYDLVGFLKKIKMATGIDVFFQSHCIDFENLDFLKKVLDFGVIESVQVPIYGHNAEIHDSVTQNSGSFESIMRALRNFKRLNFNSIQLHTLFLKQNEDCILELFSFLSEFGYKTDASLPCILTFNGKYSQSRLKNIPDLNKVSEGLKKVKNSVRNLDKLFFHDIPFCIQSSDLNDVNFDLNNTGFSNNLGIEAHKGYEHFKNSRIDTVTINKETVPTYRILSKHEACKNCILDERCFGITRPYVDLGVFKAKPFLKNC